MARRFNPANWERLLSAERTALLDRDAFLDRLGIAPGSTVADLGAGPGFFTAALAEKVGAAGRVHAVDVSPEMVEILRGRQLPSWVEVKLGGDGGLPLGDASVDAALLAFVLHELEHPAEFLAEVARVLRPDGRLVVLEWVPQEEPIGPPVHERIAEAECARVLESSGFRILDRWMPNASNYSLVARAAGATDREAR